MSDKNQISITKEIFPELEHGLATTGFFFGAGSSVVAGYPTTSELTVAVFRTLQQDIIDIISDVLQKNSLKLPDSTGTPNIEIIANVLQNHLLQTSDIEEQTRVAQCIEHIRDAVVEIIGGVENPNLTHHVRFFNALKRICSNKAQSIWIFTTNYDLCFEMAAAQAGINLVDGFLGSSTRFFSYDSIFYQLGTQTQGATPRFSRWEAPTVKLVKLHGSLDWWAVGNKIFSASKEEYLPGLGVRSIVLPQKMKHGETLRDPYSSLFDVANHILGTECKHLVSCGFRFADDHINSRLIEPKTKSSQVRITALIRQENEVVSELVKNTSFNLVTESESVIKGSKHAMGSELWEFTNLVDFLSNFAGLQT